MFMQLINLQRNTVTKIDPLKFDESTHGLKKVALDLGDRFLAPKNLDLGTRWLAIFEHASRSSLRRDGLIEHQVLHNDRYVKSLKFLKRLFLSYGKINSEASWK
uniref:Uncharacterized protein n=1 Tax=Romanomermis culicivorax TaxID=13658 RepID=A0A915HY41_ROMCU